MFYVLAEREDGRLCSEIQRLEKELEELKERKNVYEVGYRNKTNNYLLTAYMHTPQEYL